MAVMLGVGSKRSRNKCNGAMTDSNVVSVLVQKVQQRKRKGELT